MIRTALTLLLLLATTAGAYLAGTLNARTTIAVPEANWGGDSAAARAWRSLLVSLDAAGAGVFAATDSERERVEGLNYLAQLLSAALEMKVAKADPAAPQFTDWMSDYRKFLGDSPDAIYSTAEISAQYQYEVTGRVGDASYLGFMLYGTGINGWNRAAEGISLEAMQLEDDGSFRLLLAAQRPAGYAGNWLALEEDVHLLMVRQYFHDRTASEQASLGIRALGTPATAAVSDGTLGQRLDNATRFFNETVAGNLALVEMIAKTPNTFDVPREYDPAFGGVFYPTEDNLYYGGWYDLAAGEALLIEGVAPPVAYWSVSLQNRWLQSHDYHRHKVALNNRELKVDADGRYRVIIAASDPGVDNWLSTGGSRRGLVAVRYQLASDASAPVARRVPLADLAQPGETP